jgi:phage replication O-like protein O
VIEMASPQVENGFTKIANEILEALCRTPLSDYESRILHALFRKTYGFSKVSDWVSDSQFIGMVGIHKAHFSRTKKRLIQRKIVTYLGNQISFNKDYEKWLGIDGVTNLGLKVTRIGNKKLPKEAGTKEIKKYTKEKRFLSKSPLLGKELKNKDMWGHNDNDDQLPEIDLETGEGPKPSRKKESKSKLALQLVELFGEYAYKHTGKRPIKDARAYLMVLNGLKHLSKESVMDLYKDWFSKGLPTEEAILITRALSNNSINKFIATHDIKN